MKPMKPHAPCDGSVGDYLQHKRRGEKACTASKRTWNAYYRKHRS